MVSARDCQGCDCRQKTRCEGIAETRVHPPATGQYAEPVGDASAGVQKRNQNRYIDDRLQYGLAYRRVLEPVTHEDHATEAKQQVEDGGADK